MHALRNRGLTLLELMIALAVAGILASIALPSFGRMLEDNRLTQTRNALVASLQLARALAVTSGRNVILCASSDGQRCRAGSDFSLGWLVYRDDNGNGRLDPGESVRDRHQLGIGEMRIRSSDGRPQIRFRIRGTASGTNTRLILCDRHPERGAQVVVANSGRIRSNMLQGRDC